MKWTHADYHVQMHGQKALPTLWQSKPAEKSPATHLLQVWSLLLTSLGTRLGVTNVVWTEAQMQLLSHTSVKC